MRNCRTDLSQGDHGGIAYRNIVLTPALASAWIASEQPVDSSKEVAGQWWGNGL